MLSQCKLVGFAPITDADRARRFYGDVLGLSFVYQDQFAVVFEAAGNRIRLARMEKVDPAPYTILGWEVPDIDSVTSELAGRGVVFERYSFLEQNDRGVWSAPGGAKVAWFKDPDGNLLSLSQS